MDRMGVLSCSAHGFREHFHSRVVISLENGQLWRWQSLSIHRCAYLQSSKLVDDFTVIQVDVERVASANWQNTVKTLPGFPSKYPQLSPASSLATVRASLSSRRAANFECRR